MLISEIAKRSGVSKDAVRLYTAKGLITKRTLLPAGERFYADYTPETIDQIKVIRSVQNLGFTLGEIKILLDEVQPDCHLTPIQAELLHAKLHEITHKQQQLARLETLIRQKLAS